MTNLQKTESMRILTTEELNEASGGNPVAVVGFVIAAGILIKMGWDYDHANMG